MKEKHCVKFEKEKKGFKNKSCQCKLCKEDYIITDPLFEIMEIEINNENRFKTLYYIGIPYILLINFIIYYRFFT